VSEEPLSPRLIIVAGANGAGKSTLTALLKARGGERLGRVLDPDAVARELDPVNPSRAALQAGRVVLLALQDGLQQKQRMVYETTLSDKQRHFNLIAEAKSQGFIVWLFYVGLGTVERHHQRVAIRAADGLHNIPSQDITRRFERSLGNLPKVLTLVDRALIYDNAERKLRLVASLSNSVVRRSKAGGWWTAILEQLERSSQS
jgi:predicted ABC-type ATPase